MLFNVPSDQFILYNCDMIKTEKVLHLNSSKGRKVRVVREHYVREQVACGSSLCQAGCHNGKNSNVYFRVTYSFFIHIFPHFIAIVN